MKVDFGSDELPLAAVRQRGLSPINPVHLCSDWFHAALFRIMQIGMQQISAETADWFVKTHGPGTITRNTVEPRLKNTGPFRMIAWITRPTPSQERVFDWLGPSSCLGLGLNARGGVLKMGIIYMITQNEYLIFGNYILK